MGNKKNPPSWGADEDTILKEFYPSEGVEVATRLKGRTKNACKLRAKKLRIKYEDMPMPWTEEEDKILREYFSTERGKVSLRLQGRTTKACHHRAKALNLDSGVFWTEEEDAILKNYYPSEGSKVIERLPNRTVNACFSRAKQLKLLKDDPQKWTEDEDALLQKYYPQEGKKVAQRLPGRTVDACFGRAKYLKLKCEKGTWSETEIAILRELYPAIGKKVAARLPGRTEESCLSKAKSLKIRFVGNSEEEVITGKEELQQKSEGDVPVNTREPEIESSVSADNSEEISPEDAELTEKIEAYDVADASDLLVNESETADNPSKVMTEREAKTLISQLKSERLRIRTQSKWQLAVLYDPVTMRIDEDLLVDYLVYGLMYVNNRGIMTYTSRGFQMLKELRQSADDVGDISPLDIVLFFMKYSGQIVQVNGGWK